ncbi:murein DD-endopeptidase MepM [Aggregatibacter segnis]|uniref:murein DD-endopeptidase MepM n=1 Tax=Aggregatibacter segnis TaxID=739 RepID=UPI001FB4742D|nr:murein DD-endopeptidase MepM [Aggregatibacter segnis]
MVQHVKLARERRQRKSRIKALIFFSALLLIFTGFFLHLNDTAEDKIESVKNATYSNLSTQNTLSDTNHLLQEILSLGELYPVSSYVVSFTNEAIQETQILADTFNLNAVDEATSYEDDVGKDDESEEVKTHDEFDDLDTLPSDAKDAVVNILDVADQAMRIKDQFSHTVVKGDTLKDILELSGLEDDTSKQLIAAYPELNHLQAGQQFYWILNNDGELEYLNWLVSQKKEHIYELQPEGKFNRQILEKKSVWMREVLRGEMDGSFVNSLKKLGLNSRQIYQLISALQWQVSLKQLKKDTKISILVSREYLEEKRTGQGNVEAIHIMTGGKGYYAIQAANGRYYNRQGETLGKGFSRYPLQRQARVSSPFNPRRLHPVTGRIAPHKGVDFSMPIGTPVIAPADGTVEKIAYQANGAGRYVVIRHSREYQTVYMHLSRPLVKAGQSVKKGERIALSGNTGRSTGPHLHYEFHINGRPVNPLTVKLPGGSSGMATAERKEFLVKANEVERLLR